MLSRKTIELAIEALRYRIIDPVGWSKQMLEREKIIKKNIEILDAITELEMIRGERDENG